MPFVIGIKETHNFSLTTIVTLSMKETRNKLIEFKHMQGLKFICLIY